MKYARPEGTRRVLDECIDKLKTLLFNIYITLEFELKALDLIDAMEKERDRMEDEPQ
jgi:hypothetical protein